MKPLCRFSWSAFGIALNFLFAAGSGATPVVVFNSFGPGNTYSSTVAWGVTGNATQGGYRGQAEWFVPAIPGELSSVTLATYRQSGSGRSNFFLAQDSGSSPGTVLESFLNTANNPNGLLTLNSVARPMLQTGVKYWICDEPADTTTFNGWYENSQNYAPGFAFERSQWSWSFVGPPSVPPSGVFSVSVTAVPEPAAMVLVALGLVLRLQLHQRHGGEG
jgi:hypothetical protein